VSYVPIPSKVGEMKTKPTQYAARSLNSVGIQADIIIARAEMPLDKKRKEKIALFCNIPAEQVISAPDVESIYDIPLNFERDNLGVILSRILWNGDANKRASNLASWKQFVESTKRAKKTVTIGVVGKYFNSGEFVLSDVYISVLEAVKFSAYKQGAKAVIKYISSQQFEAAKPDFSVLAECDGILVPGGFGSTGIEGIIAAIRYARERKIPYFGICYGMQLMLVEYARDVLGWKDAHTAEVSAKTKHPVIDIIPEQKEHMAAGNYGGTMRLGSYPAHLERGTIARKAYGEEMIKERHRHRYEVNPPYIKDFERAGVVFSGVSPSGVLMEISELPKEKHPFFLGCQFHPEMLARPLRPHPLFSAFIKASLEYRGKK
jgi:CTP synthase